MKNATKPLSIMPLKQERRKRNWIQADLAEKVGGEDAFDRLDSFHSPNGWQCWAPKQTSK